MRRLILHFLSSQAATQVNKGRVDYMLAACAALSPLVEPYGAKELFADLTGVNRARSAVINACRQAPAKTAAQSGPSLFVLLAPNKFLARLGTFVIQSAYPANTPFLRTETAGDAVVGELSPAYVEPFLAQLPVHYLWPVAAVVRSRLVHLGITTFGDIALIPRGRLVAEFGPHTGTRLGELARGIDTTPVRALYPPRQLTVRYDFPPEHHMGDNVPVTAALIYMAQELARKLQTRGEACSVLMLRCSGTDGQKGKAVHLKTPTQHAAVIQATSRQLYARLDSGTPPRHLALIATQFTAPTIVQTGLFTGNQGQREKASDSLRLVNAMQRRFGQHALQFATGLPRQRREKVHALWGV